MSIKDVDFLSQEISLFFYGKTRHSSNFGGLLTILMILFCLAYISYIISGVYLHSTSSVQYYRHFFKNPGIYYFNNTEGIFHYFLIYNPNNNQISSFNSKYIRLFMTNMQEEYKSNPDILSKNDHWVYDNCRDGIDNKNLSEELFKDISFKNGLCLRYYYNSEYKKYYPIEDYENFKFPHLTNLGANMNYSIGTIIEKCNNHSILTRLLGDCGTKVEIEDYLSHNFGVIFNILTHEIRPGIYGSQTYDFIYGISNHMKRNLTIENNLIFNPLITFFYGGIFLPQKNETQIYSYSESNSNEVESNISNLVISIYNFKLAQYGYIYKANYQTIYDSLHKIGGIIQLIYYIFFGINYIFNQFTIIDDSKKLFFTLHNEEKINGGKHIKNFSKIVHILRQRHIFTDSSSKILGKLTHNFKSSNFQKHIDIDNSKSLSVFPFISEKDLNIYNKFNSKIITNNSEALNDVQEEMNLNKKIKEENSSPQNELINKKRENKTFHIKCYDKEKKEKYNILKNKQVSQVIRKNRFSFNLPKNEIIDKDIIDFKNLLKKYFNYKKMNFFYEKMTIDKINHLFTIGNYLFSLFGYKKPKYYFSTLERFRRKLLSEEHFFRTHNYLYLIEKCFDFEESKKIDIVELYKNL